MTTARKQPELTDDEIHVLKQVVKLHSFGNILLGAVTTMAIVGAALMAIFGNFHK